MSTAKKEIIYGFILKRSFRRGLVTPTDIVRATGVSPATAGRHVASAEVRFAKHVQRMGSGLEPKPLAEAPEIAGEAALLKDLEGTPFDPLKTGLFEDELPVVQVHWTQALPMKPGVLSLIVQAIQHETALHIVYLGLRLDEKPRRRRVLPLALERMNDQWRVVAQDLEKPGGELRVFVLARILDAKPDPKGVPRNILQPSHYDMPEKLEVILNPKLNAEQRQMIARELQVKDGTITIPARSRHEFLRRFSDQPVSPDAVWPLIFLKRSY